MSETRANRGLGVSDSVGSAVAPDGPHDTSIVTPSALWRAFASPLVKGLDGPGGIARARSALRLGLPWDADRSLGDASIAQVYEDVFRRLAKGPQAEYFYKSVLLQHYVLSRRGRKTNRVFFEFRSGRSKLDVLIATREKLIAYEVKTELDHLRRLPGQLADYAKRFPEVWVLTTERAVDRVASIANTTVGIAYLSERGHLRIARDSQICVDHLESVHILECLRRDEYLAVLSEFGFELRDLPNTRIFSQAMTFASTLDPWAVHMSALAAIRSRAGRLSGSALAKIPRSLRAACVAAQCTDRDIEEIRQLIYK